MKAIILAAGQAKRLWPITKKLPKCFLKIKDKNILDRQIESLIKNDIKDIILVVGFKQKSIISYLNKKYPDINFEFIDNKKYKTTNVAYSLWLAEHHLHGSIIYLNSDVLYHHNIIKRIIDDKHESVTALRRVPWDEEEVKIITNKNMKIKKIGKEIPEQKSYGEFIGVTKLGKDFNEKLIKALDYFIMNKKDYHKFAADAINLAIQKWNGEIYALDVTLWPAMEIDTISDFKKARKIWKI